MLERISAIIFNCREALGKLEALRGEMSKVKCEREEAQSEKLAVSGKELIEKDRRGRIKRIGSTNYNNCGTVYNFS